MNKMGYKSIIVALILAFSVMVGGAWAETSTVEGYFVFDKSVVTAGDSVNVGIMGLNSSGEVDIYGEQFGSTIFATVSSVLGTVKTGGTSPSSLKEGNFASDVKYIQLVQGKGKANIYYDSAVSGTDTVAVTLQETYTAEGGGPVYKTISTFTQSVVVGAKTQTVAWLDVTNFTHNSGDGQGSPSSAADINQGISGAMTAGTSGGQFQVVAYTATGSTTTDKAANGTCTLYLTGNPNTASKVYNKVTSATQYTLTGVMSQGVAVITVDTTITKAGSYFVHAEFGGTNSTNSYYPDQLLVLPKTTTSKFGISTEKGVVGNLKTNTSWLGASTTIRVWPLDEYGNKTTLSSATTVKLVDTAEICNPSSPSQGFSTAVYFVDYTITPIQYSSGKTGTAKFVAKHDVTTPTITQSDEKQVAVKNSALWAKFTATASGSTLQAGKTYSYLLEGLGYTDATASATTSTLPGGTSVTVYYYVAGSLKSSSTTTVDTLGNVAALFKTSSTNGVFIVGDDSGNYGQYTIYNTGLTDPEIKQVVPGDAKTSKLFDGNDNLVTTIPLTKAGDNYEAYIYNDKVYVYDGESNTIKSSGIQYKASSTNAKTISSDGLGTAYSGSNQGFAQKVTVTYDPSKFTGTDDTFKIALVGVPGSTDLKPTVTVPAKSSLATIQMSISQTTIPLNGDVPLCVETLDQNGKRMEDTSGITMELGGALAATVTPTVKQLTTAGTAQETIFSGQFVSFNSTKTGITGRNILDLSVSNLTGEFTITLKNSAGTVTATKQFSVKKLAEQVVDVGKEEGITEVTEPADSLVNLYVNTTPQTGDTAVYEWFVFTATFADASAAKLPLYLLATDGTIVAVVDGIDIYDYTFDYGTSSVQLIAELTMADLGLVAGDVFAYAYAYQNELGDIYLPNVVFITVE